MIAQAIRAIYARFLSTLRPAAGSATTTFFPVAPVVPAFLLSAVFAADAALATPPFLFSAGLIAVEFEAAAVRPPRFGLITVVPLDAVEIFVVLLCVLVWLIVRCGEAGTAGLGGGSICPLVISFFSLLAVRLSLAAVAVPPRFACSIIPCILAEMADVAAVAADLRGEVGRMGDMAVVGRAIMLFAGELGRQTSLMGERGRVREL